MIIGMTAGTMMGVWLGQLITEQGIGNGVSLIIFAGIVANIPYQLHVLAQSPVMLIIFLIVTRDHDRRDRVGAGRPAPHPGAVW